MIRSRRGAIAAVAIAAGTLLGACRRSEAPHTDGASSRGEASSAPVPSRSSSFSISSPPSALPATPGVASDAGDVEPPELACIVRYYSGRSLHEDGSFWLVLGDGTKIPWDDGRTKTMEERIASPDIEDVFARRYVAGPIAPVTDPEEDPGRVRIEALFRATYGASAKDVSAALVPVHLRGHVVRVHARIAKPLERVARRLEEAIAADASLARFFENLGGTFNARTIAGTDRSSAHAWGIAIDIDPSLSHYWRNDRGAPVWKNRVPRPLVVAFEAEGFIWGGRWFHYDTMHFEFRPELLDPRCRRP